MCVLKNSVVEDMTIYFNFLKDKNDGSGIGLDAIYQEALSIIMRYAFSFIPELPSEVSCHHLLMPRDRG